jgi:LPXTG-motif cell wall-anchored protein
VTTPGGNGPTTHVTHHHTPPSVNVGGATGGEHQAPEGELAHTGGNTAVLAIVAGSLLAAGAGLAVAGRMGKDGPDTEVTEG